MTDMVTFIKKKPLPEGVYLIAGAKQMWKTTGLITPFFYNFVYCGNYVFLKKFIIFFGII